MREDLDTGYIDFNNVYIGNNVAPINIFEEIINKYEIHDGYNPTNNPNDTTCVRYASQYLQRTWPCSTPTCNK